MNTMQFPADFITVLKRQLPENIIPILINGLDSKPITSVRINPKKMNDYQFSVDTQLAEHCNELYYLKERPLFALDPLLHAGVYYVQDSSSAFIGQIFSQIRSQNWKDSPIAVLDLCAAPGGKSTHISAQLQANDVLVANEIIKSRLTILQENLYKQGNRNCVVTSMSAAQFGPCLFEIVVADLPCSGEGMFRKDKDAILEWSMANVELCAQRQMKIVHEIWPSIKDNGYFIYSTCTLNYTENEENIQKICKSYDCEIVEFNFPENWNVLCFEKGCYRLLPGFFKGEGLFFAVLKKKGKNLPSQKKKFLGKNEILISKEKNNFVKSGSVVLQKATELYLIDFDFLKINEFSFFYPCIPGIPIGVKMRDKFKPNCNLALQHDVNESEFEVLELDEEAIIPFLKRDALKNPKQLAEHHLVRFKQTNLGFVNGVRNHFNNLWPMEWRLRMQTERAASIFK